MAQTLSAINRTFSLVADLHSEGGEDMSLIRDMCNDKIGTVDAFDLNPQADEIFLDLDDADLPANHYGLILSNLGLHHVNKLPLVLRLIHDALIPDGLFIGAFFGGQTLIELRQSLNEAESAVRGGSGPRLAPSLDGADMIGLLSQAGFTMPVVDHDRLEVIYDHPLSLLHDLRAMGETNILLDRPRLGLNKAIVRAFCDHYVAHFSHPDGGVVASFEILTLSGWRFHSDQQRPLKPGQAKTRLADALGVIEIKT